MQNSLILTTYKYIKCLVYFSNDFVILQIINLPAWNHTGAFNIQGPLRVRCVCKSLCVWLCCEVLYTLTFFVVHEIKCVEVISQL